MRLLRVIWGRSIRRARMIISWPARDVKLRGKSSLSSVRPATYLSESRGSGAEFIPFSSAACSELTSVNRSVAGINAADLVSLSQKAWARTSRCSLGLKVRLTSLLDTFEMRHQVGERMRSVLVASRYARLCWCRPPCGFVANRKRGRRSLGRWSEV